MIIRTRMLVMTGSQSKKSKKKLKLEIYSFVGKILHNKIYF